MEENTYHDIYRYLNQEMTVQDSADFEKKILADDHLAQEVALHQDLLGGIEHRGDEELKNQIQQAASQLEKDGFFKMKQGGRRSDQQGKTGSGQRIQTLFQPRYLAVAASLMVLLVVSFFLLQPSVDTQQLYSESFQLDNALLQQQLDELDFTGMGNPKQAQNKSLMNGLVAIEDNNFSRAAYELTKHLETYPDDEVAALFLGQTRMRQRQYEKAYAHLAPISQKDGLYQVEALWYLALSTLQIQTRSEETKPLLEQIMAHPDSTYAQQAKLLLEKL